MNNLGDYLNSSFAAINERCGGAIHVEVADGRLARTEFDERRYQGGEIAMLYPPKSGETVVLIESVPFAVSEELELMLRNQELQVDRFRYTGTRHMHALTLLPQ